MQLIFKVNTILRFFSPLNCEILSVRIFVESQSDAYGLFGYFFNIYLLIPEVNESCNLAMLCLTSAPAKGIYKQEISFVSLYCDSSLSELFIHRLTPNHNFYTVITVTLLFPLLIINLSIIN